MQDALELPADVAKLRTQELEELASSESLVAGLWESLPKSQKSCESTIEAARLNEEKITELKNKLENINKLLAQSKKLQEQECTLANKWEETESQMYAKAEPYSAPSIRKKVQAEIDKSRDTASAIEKKILDPELEAEDAFVLTKRYFQTRQRYYFNQCLLESM